MVAGSVILYSEEDAAKVSRRLDGKVDYILVDAEKKTPNAIWGAQEVSNVERVVRETVTKSRILTYKGNDITVDAIDYLITQLLSTNPRGVAGKRAGIVGAGNIGCKLALKLVERGMSVSLFRRDSEKLLKIVSALNLIKPLETVAKVRAAENVNDLAEGVSVLIGLTQGVAAINGNMINQIANEAIIIDGGKGSLDGSALERACQKGIPVYRADVRLAFEHHLEMLLGTESALLGGLGRANFDGVPVVSSGLLGYLDEVVVDSINFPRHVFGVANGLGDFKRDLTVNDTDSLSTVVGYIKRNTKRCT